MFSGDALVVGAGTIDPASPNTTEGASVSVSPSSVRDFDREAVANTGRRDCQVHKAHTKTIKHVAITMPLHSCVWGDMTHPIDSTSSSFYLEPTLPS